MSEPRQKFMEILGEEGCYFLSIIHIGERVTGERIDAIPIFLEALEREWVKLDGLVLNAAGVLELATGVAWVKSYESKDYVVKVGEFEILKFYRKVGTGRIEHFVVGDGEGGIEYDPYGASRTVREGILESKRIFHLA